MTTRSTWVLAAIIVVVYVLASLDHLAVFPPVGQDEPWIAAAPYKLATEGIYGSDLFAGYYGSEAHLYQMPVYSLLQAGVFEVAGLGVVQMRVLPVAFGLLLLGLVFAVGRQLGGNRVGLLAMLLLVGVRLAMGWDETGIPLLDIARVNRYDIAVPVFGLAAFWTFHWAEERGRARGYLIVGLLIGLASLSHLTGVFWLPALFVIMLLRRGKRLFVQHDLYAMIGGFVLLVLPWLVYIAAGWSDFVGQYLPVASRFDLFDPQFYLDNLRYEYRRYVPLAPRDAAGTWHLPAFGTVVALVGVPWALWELLRPHRSKDRLWALSIVLIVQGVLFALLLENKFYNYLIALWPLATLALAGLGLRLWDRYKTTRGRGVLLAVLTLLLLEGGWRVVHRHRAALHTTPYDQFTSRIAQHILPGSRVLGLQHYWAGLHQYEYRTWLLPIQLSDSLYYHAPMPLDQALERVDPDVILLDRYMTRYFDEIADLHNPRYAQYLGFRAFMDRHQAALVGVVEDPTYGTMHLYQMDAAPNSPPTRLP